MINQTPASGLKFQRTAPTQRMSKRENTPKVRDR